MRRRNGGTTAESGSAAESRAAPCSGAGSPRRSGTARRPNAADAGSSAAGLYPLSAAGVSLWAGAERQTNTGLLGGSIINLVICCLPLGIAGLIFTLNAKNALNAEEEAQKLKTAKTCNLIGTIGGAVVVILYVILMMVGIFGSIAMY